MFVFVSVGVEGRKGKREGKVERDVETNTVREDAHI